MRSFARNSAASLLPAMAYNSEENLFLLEGKGIGFAFMCEPLYVTDDKVGERLNVLLNQDWPKNTILQTHLWTSPDIGKTLFEYESLSIRQNSILGDYRKQRSIFLKEHTTTPLGRSEIRLRNIESLITVRIPTNGEFPTEKEIEAASSLRRSVLQALESCGMPCDLIDAASYIRFMSTILNQGPNASWRDTLFTPYDDKDLIRNQIFDYDNEINVDRDGVWLGEPNKGTRVKTLSIKRYPEYSALGVARRFLTEPLHGSRGIHENTLLTATIVFPDSEAARGRMEQERQWVTNQAYGPMMKWAPRLADKKYSYDSLFEALDDGDCVVKLYLGITLLCPPGQEEAAVSNARAYFREGGYQVLEDKCICLPLFLTNLPFGADPKMVKESFRFKTMATRHAVTQLPLFGGWKGTGTPALNFVGRDGQLMNLSLFDSGSGFNCVIAARTGSGKSFLTNELIMSYLSKGGRCWVIDVGRSYEKLTKYLPGGQFLEFSENSQVCLNPFDLVADYNEEADLLCGIIGAMAAPKAGLDDFQTAGVKRVLSAMWEKYSRDLTIDILAEKFLEEEDRRLRDIGEQLFPFTKKGEYGRFFAGRNNVSFTGALATIELEELKGRKHLQQVVLYIAVYQINQDMYLGDRDREKVLIIDEAWDLLKDGDMSLFIMTAFRRIRKYGGAAIVCTQGLEDLYETANGRAIAENATNKYLLRQGRETVTALEENKRLDIGEFGFKLMKTVQTIPGEFSEIFFQTEGGVGVGRLYVAPFMKLLYSSKADDVTEIRYYTDQEGLSLTDAINAVLEKRKNMQRGSSGPHVSLPVSHVSKNDKAVA